MNFGTSVLENELLHIEMAHYGAELLSFRSCVDDFELLWQRISGSWMRSAPTVFPILGGWKDDTYYLDGKKIYMQKNGFARSMVFKLVRKTESQITLLLKHSAETMSQYPFEFCFYVEYTLDKSKLDIGYRIENHSDIPMPFVVGGHPGFVWNANKILADIVFQKKETINAYRPNGTEFVLADGVYNIQLKKEDFTSGAISSKKISSDWIEWYCNDRIGIRLHRGDMNYLTLWTLPQKDAEFLCIEPSTGAGTRGQTFDERLGNKWIDPGQYMLYEYTIELI